MPPRQFMYKSATDNDFTQWLGPVLRQLDTFSTFNLPYNTSVLVRESAGSLITLDDLIDTREESDLIAIPLNPSLTMGLSWVWRKNQELSPAATFQS